MVHIRLSYLFPVGAVKLRCIRIFDSETPPGTQFQPVLPDAPMKQIERVVLVSGEIYYELAKERAARGLEDRVALIRIEELAPFPFAYLADIIEPYASPSPKLEWWVQGEPKNQGTWGHVKDRYVTWQVDWVNVRR